MFGHFGGRSVGEGYFGGREKADFDRVRTHQRLRSDRPRRTHFGDGLTDFLHHCGVPQRPRALREDRSADDPSAQLRNIRPVRRFDAFGRGQTHLPRLRSQG